MTLTIIIEFISIYLFASVYHIVYIRKIYVTLERGRFKKNHNGCSFYNF